MAHDEETLAGICADHGVDPKKALAWNKRCTHFQGGLPLTLVAKLRHHTAVLLP